MANDPNSTVTVTVPNITGTVTSVSIPDSTNTGYISTCSTLNNATHQIQDPKYDNLTVTSDMDIQGDLTIGGVSLSERLDRIEKMLELPPVLRENKELQEKHDELKQAADDYKKLEQKYITWENMKK